MRRTHHTTGTPNRFTTVRGVTLPLLLVMLAGAVGCADSASERNPYWAQEDETDIHGDDMLRSRPVLTADEQARIALRQDTTVVERDRVVREQPTTIQRRDTVQRETASRDTGMNTVTAAFPTGDRDSSVLLVERMAPGEVVVGAPFTYKMRVTNISDLTLADVFVAETHSEGLEITSANFRPVEGLPRQWFMSGNGQQLQAFEWGDNNDNNFDAANGRAWQIGTLQPGQSEVIEVEARTERQGPVTSCVYAGFTPEVCMTMNAVAPSLQIRLDAPDNVLICEDIPLRFVVTNTGSGTARDVKVRVPLTDGLRSVETRGGGANDGFATFNAGDIGPGQSKEVTVRARAERTGDFTTRAEAVSAMGMTAEAEQATFTVVQPTLSVTIDTPETQYLGRDVPSRVTVTNTSNVTAPDVRVNANISGNARLTDEAGSGNNAWNLGDLAPGESKSTTLFVSTREIGEVRGRVTANARCVEAQSDEFRVNFTGIPALLLEVVDNRDPVPMGEDTTYTIRVTNQGSTPATNIRIQTVLPNELEFLDARGASDFPNQGERGAAANQGKNIQFAPLASLPPKATAEWTIRVKATGAGDIRFGTSMTADQLDSPVEETESTNLYR